MLTGHAPRASEPNECVAAVVVKLPGRLSKPQALSRNAQEATETNQGFLQRKERVKALKNKRS